MNKKTEWRRNDYAQNPTKYLARNKASYERNKVNRLQSCKEYRDKHGEQIRLYNMKYRERTVGGRERGAKIYYESKREDIKTRAREYGAIRQDVSLMTADNYGQIWGWDELKDMKKLAKTKTQLEVAVELGRSMGGLRCKAYQLGISFKKPLIFITLAQRR